MSIKEHVLAIRKEVQRISNENNALMSTRTARQVSLVLDDIDNLMEDYGILCRIIGKDISNG